MKQTIYRTPGRECAHAKRGCCPDCYDPMGLLRSTREFTERMHPKHLVSTPSQEQQKEKTADGNT